MQGLKTIWKEAAWVFILSRTVILLFSYLSIVLLPRVTIKRDVTCIHDLPYCLFAWYHFDAQSYVQIASQGYIRAQDAAYFPLLPLFEHGGAFLLGGYFPSSYYLAGLLIANCCFYFALALLYCLLSQDFDPALAKRGLFYFAFSPYALFFFAGYSESLFVLLTIALFLLLRRERLGNWWIAGFLGFLAVLTRSSGIILVVPFLVNYIQRFWRQREQDQKRWLYQVCAGAPVFLIPAGVVAFMLFLGFAKGNPFLFISEENAAWHRHLSLPWNGIGFAIDSLFTHLYFSLGSVYNLLNLTFTLIPLGVLIIGWQRIPFDYRFFSLGIILFTLSFPRSVDPLASEPRYLMILFPVTTILALWGKESYFNRCFVGSSLALLAFNICLFTNHYWVA